MSRQRNYTGWADKGIIQGEQTKELYRVSRQRNYTGWADEGIIQGEQTKELYRVSRQRNYTGWADKGIIRIYINENIKIRSMKGKNA